jgi:hypothetical protein
MQKFDNINSVKQAGRAWEQTPGPHLGHYMKHHFNRAADLYEIVNGGRNWVRASNTEFY